MNQHPMRPDTADRIRPCTYIRHDGKARMVERVALAPTVARPGRIRLFLTDLSGRLDQAGEPIHLDAGEIIDQTWDPCCPRPTAADLAQTDPADQTIHGLRIGATVHIIGSGGTYRIEDVSRAANEVRIGRYWVSADLAEAAHDAAQSVAVVAEVAPVEYCGDPVDPNCGPDLGKPWCHYHAAISTPHYVNTETCGDTTPIDLSFQIRVF